MDESKEHKFGLLGRDISYSFSPAYFQSKFEALHLDGFTYELFDTENVADVRLIASDENLIGFNVTIPYKESVIPHLDKLSRTAREIGAVNTVKKLADGRLKGYNTDWYGFRKALKPLLKPHHESALILGTGGASKAVAYALREMGITFQQVSRKSSEDAISYDELTSSVFDKFHIVINCTPLGSSGHISASPDIPYHYFTSRHLAFDLIYNPPQSEFLKKASEKGAAISNGFSMLEWQAEKAWKIWNR